MSYRYLDDLTAADVAFRAVGSTLEELFVSAWEATLRVMVENTDSLRGLVSKNIALEDQSLDLLLYNFLQELLFYKDAEALLLKLRDCRVDRHRVSLEATAVGEQIDQQRHRLGVDVKAVTFHKFSLQKKKDLWQATAILDV